MREIFANCYPLQLRFGKSEKLVERIPALFGKRCLEAAQMADLGGCRGQSQGRRLLCAGWAAVMSARGGFECVHARRMAGREVLRLGLFSVVRCYRYGF